jgi:UDP-N-acetylglucosamine--N-acetylmuramyl-(pentapeptide) pyrophosphoryl-undecaprenol N-acetylglucosamine transferase
VLGRLARRVCTTFAESNRYFPSDKVVLTGNPVRTFAPSVSTDEHGFTVMTFGGSQGAHRINEAFYEAAPALLEAIEGLRIIHQTGAADRARLQARYQEVGVTADVHAFIDDIGAAYGQADLIVCRAGATTVAELTALGKPAILVPYPFAADDHQRANASVLADNNAGILIPDRDLTGERLAAAIIGLATDRARLTAMGAAARRLATPDSAARVVDVCCEVVAEGETYG